MRRSLTPNEFLRLLMTDNRPNILEAYLNLWSCHQRQGETIKTLFGVQQELLALLKSTGINFEIEDDTAAVKN